MRLVPSAASTATVSAAPAATAVSSSAPAVEPATTTVVAAVVAVGVASTVAAAEEAVVAGSGSNAGLRAFPAASGVSAPTYKVRDHAEDDTDRYNEYEGQEQLHGTILSLDDTRDARSHSTRVRPLVTTLAFTVSPRPDRILLTKP